MWVQGHKAKTKKLAEKMYNMAMSLIEKHKSADGPNVDNDKLNLVDILLSQKGEDKLPNHAMAAVLFVSISLSFPPRMHKTELFSIDCRMHER